MPRISSYFLFFSFEFNLLDIRHFFFHFLCSYHSYQINIENIAIFKIHINTTILCIRSMVSCRPPEIAILTPGILYFSSSIQSGILLIPFSHLMLFNVLSFVCIIFGLYFEYHTSLAKCSLLVGFLINLHHIHIEKGGILKVLFFYFKILIQNKWKLN